MTATIIVNVITQLVEETRALIVASKEADALATAYERKLGEQREIQKARRIELGMLIRKAHDCLPKNNRNGNGFGDYLEAIEMSTSTAYKYMADAGWVSDRSSPHHGGNEGQASDSSSADSDVPPHTDADAPPDADSEPSGRGARDGWCTPEPIAAALPRELDLDPCSNPRSIVVAKTAYSLEVDQDGLALPWFGLVFVNGPYSNLLPWGEKLAAERANIKGAGFLVNADNSPEWWHLLTAHLHLRLDFNERLEFIPPEGIEPSKNDRPQTLLMDAAFWKACDQRALLALGTLWIKQPKEQ